MGFRTVAPGGSRRGLCLRGAVVLLDRAVFQRNGKLGFDLQETNRQFASIWVKEFIVLPDGDAMPSCHTAVNRNVPFVGDVEVAPRDLELPDNGVINSPSPISCAQRDG